MAEWGPACVFCGKAVTLRRAAYRVEGWETTRAGGGANRILGRKRLGDVAHVECAEDHVRKAARGLVGQEQLFG